MIFKYLQKFSILLGLLLSLSGGIVGQTSISETKYDSLKSLGLINILDAYSFVLDRNNNRSTNQFTPPDSTFILAMAPSDDGSSDVISLPFDFCFWGNPENQVFINTNGNISFDKTFSTGTPFRLPFNGFKIIAPFWSDVDTRARGGVYYKVLPNALIVNWEDVGRFDQNNFSGNSYQLIITDGTSELLPFGYTVGFFYDKLEWTAGDASGGIGGFGGAPAVIGINYGDGIRYSQAGRFDKSDTTFIPDIDTLNGVEKLMGKHIYFNPCDSVNNIPGLMGSQLKDTIGVCVGDTLRDVFYFFAPESDQLTYVQLSASNFPGYQLLGTTTGQMATAEIEIVGSVANFGFHTISFAVVDNGHPSQFLEFDLVVQVDSLPIPMGIIGDSSICEYDTTQLAVPNVYETYLWNTGQNTSTIDVTPGNYEITVSYNNCYATDRHLVNAHVPNVTIVGPKYICLPDTVLLTSPIGNDSYRWSTTDTTSQISVTQNGEYSLTVTDQGCIKSDSLKVYLLSELPVRISTSNFNSCNGDLVTLAVPDYFDKVQWSNGDTTNSIMVSAGSYFVTVSVFSGNGNICTSTDSIQINSASITPIALNGDSLICGNGKANYAVLGNYDSYMWDNESSSQTTTYDSSGFHWVSVTQGTCIDSAFFQIIGNPRPIVSITGSLFYCDTVDSSRLVAVGGVWDSLYWNTGDTTDTIYTGFGWKKITVWKDGCSSIDDFPVNELINGVDVKGITEICPGQSTRLEVEFGFDLYQWNNGAIGFSTLATTPGKYWCVVHLDSCFATTDTITVTVQNPDTVKILGDTVMCDSAGGFIYTDISFQSFIWNTGERTPGIQYSSPGIYSVTVEDSGFCVTSDTLDVIQLPPLNVSISGNTFYCFQDSGIIRVDSFDHYLWSNGDTSQVLKAREGVYSVTVTNDNGCKGKDQNWKIISSNPKIEISHAPNICENRQADLILKTTRTDSFLWSTGEITDTIFVFPGVYSVTLTDKNGCTVDSTYDFVGLVSPNVGLRINPDEISDAYLPVHFMDESNAKGQSVGAWFWGITDAIIGSSEDTVVTFYSGEELNVIHALTLQNGCTDTASLSYTISSDIVKVNIITPNGDGINDYLVFPNLAVYQTNELIIFNRWGTEVARFKNYRNFWDANGMIDGVYFYVLYLDETQEPIKGSFTIIR